MKHIKKKHTPEEILNLVNGHPEKGEESKAKYLMTLTTGLGIKDKKDVVQGLRKLKVEDITKTDLTDINKFGCSLRIVINLPVTRIISSLVKNHLRSNVQAVSGRLAVIAVTGISND